MYEHNDDRQTALDILENRNSIYFVFTFKFKNLKRGEAEKITQKHCKLQIYFY
jgi:hypothetical protein